MFKSFNIAQMKILLLKIAVIAVKELTIKLWKFDDFVSNEMI